MSVRRKNPELDKIVEAIIYLQAEGRRQAREQCARLGVSPTQLNVLKLLQQIGDLSLSELSKRIAAQNSTVTGIVDRMAQAGLVVREQSDKDRRVWRIRMTPKGQDIARAATVAPWQILADALDALTGDERQQLYRILGKLADRIDGAAAKE